jgi:4-hydroxymandelate oxidase
VPRAELVNVLEYEAEAARVLSPALHARVTGSDRAVFDRTTLRPRMNIPTTDLDLTVTLFGEEHFAPIIVAPMGEQKVFHAEGEMATIRGASTARTAVIVSARSSTPITELAAQAKSPLWYQVFAADRTAAADLSRGLAAGCKVACVTLGGPPPAPMAAQWTTVQSLGKMAGTTPLVVKGITSVEMAKRAIGTGARGLIVSSYGQPAAPVLLLQLPAIVDAAGSQVPVLIDGGFRRGTDIVKALAYGARAVLVGRPVMWGLAAYGAEGVQGVLEMLQTETARYMAMCCRPNLAALSRDMVRVHEPRPAPKVATPR